MAKEKKITQFLLPELMLIQNTQNIMARIQFPFSTKSMSFAKNFLWLYPRNGKMGCQNLLNVKNKPDTDRCFHILLFIKSSQLYDITILTLQIKKLRVMKLK